MLLEEPSWWYAESSRPRWQARALLPVAAIYGRLVERRFETTPAWRPPLPVICVGNFTAGGTGKTPLSLFIAERLVARGETPYFLTRGYKGRLARPLFVEGGRHSARDVGDEPLLLAARAPTVVSRDREAGARLIASREASVIVMDDGLQNPALAKDLTIAVVDGVRGIGNGMVVPSGPLRAALAFQLARTDCIVVNGPPERSSDVVQIFKQRFPGPVLAAAVGPAEETGWLERQAVVAYAGIGNPGRFFALLEKLGAKVVERVAFADHKELTANEARRLMELAERHRAALVTTAKDHVRLSGTSAEAERLRSRSRALAIRLELGEGDEARFQALLDGLLRRARQR